MERTDGLRIFPAAAGAGLALALSLAAGPVRADAVGVWLTAGGESRVAIAPCEDKLCGEIVWLEEPLMPDGSPKADLLNEDEALRGRPVLGLRILSGFVPDGDGKWTDGQVYSLRAGKSFDAELSLSGPDTLEVEACAFLFSCRTQAWTRVE